MVRTGLGLFDKWSNLELSPYKIWGQSIRLGPGKLGNEKHTILVVDDEDDICLFLKDYLEAHGYAVFTANDGEAMRGVMKDEEVDLVILDLVMPGEDGPTLTRSLRENSNVAIIILTGKDEEVDRIVGLEMGADDYVTKPFSPRELLARIKSVLRRAHSLPPQRQPVDAAQVQFEGWTLDLARRQIIDAENIAIPLSAAEFALLDAFLRHPRMVLSRDQLLDLTQGREANVFDRSIDNQVSRLRKKIEADPKNPALITTVRGGGYMFTSSVKRL